MKQYINAIAIVNSSYKPDGESNNDAKIIITDEVENLLYSHYSKHFSGVVSDYKLQWRDSV